MQIPPTREPDPTLTPQSPRVEGSEWVTNTSESIHDTITQFLLWKLKSSLCEGGHTAPGTKSGHNSLPAIMTLSAGKAFGLRDRAGCTAPPGMERSAMTVLSGYEALQIGLHPTLPADTQGPCNGQQVKKNLRSSSFCFKQRQRLSTLPDDGFTYWEQISSDGRGMGGLGL